jgi:hypothetical protein
MKRILPLTSKKSVLSLALLLLALAGAGAMWNQSAISYKSPAQPDAATKARINEAYGQLPLSFEANVGQVDPEIDFISRGSRGQCEVERERGDARTAKLHGPWTSATAEAGLDRRTRCCLRRID